MRLPNIFDAIMEHYLFPVVPKANEKPLPPTFDIGGVECLLKTRSNAKCWVFYCHGNSVTLSDLWGQPSFSVAEEFSKRCECNFIAPAYPAELQSGTLGGDQIHQQVIKAYKQILCDQQTPVFLVGRSLGVGVALRLALEGPPAGLVCMSGFDSVRQLVPVACAPLRCFVSEQYNNQKMIADAELENINKIVIHGRKDTLIPSQHAENLAESCNNSELHIVEHMDHNPTSSQWTEMLHVINHFIDRQPPRQTSNFTSYKLWKR